MAHCEVCGKTTRTGRSRQHRRGVAGKRWKNRVTPTLRVFRANIQSTTVSQNGKEKSIKLCTKCIKRRKFDSAKQALSA